MKPAQFGFCLIVLSILTCAGFSTAWGDPPNRVGRLDYISGTVSYHPESVEDWAPATLNYPLTIGDNLWTDQDGQAEVHVGSTAIRLAASTEISFLNLDDQTIQIRFSVGSLNIRVRELASNEQIEIDTPNASLAILRAGSYRVDVQQSGDTAATVRSGEIEVTAGTSVFPVAIQQRVDVTGLDSPAYQIAAAPALDGWDQWCQARDQKEDHVASAQYVPRDLDGVEDLDQNGTWSNDPNLGPIWTPAVTIVGWAPYRFGHWAWVDPWGWTWIDDAPWGFAPFHYGRWINHGGAWAWVPGAHVSHAVYAPALVAFVGGSGWRPNQAPGESVGWFPLGPHEPYVAAYRSDKTRMHNVDVEHMTYVNRSVPGAVTIVPNDAFVHGRPVGRAALTVSNDELLRVPVRGAVSPIVPQRDSLYGGAAMSGGRIAQPPASVMSRPVVARMTPPSGAAPFAARQQALAAHPGQPFDAGTLSNLNRSAPPARSSVKVVTPGRTVGQPTQQPQIQARGNSSSNPVPRQPAAAPGQHVGAAAQYSPRPATASGQGNTRAQTQPAARQPVGAAQGRASTSPRQPAAPAARGRTPSNGKDEKLLKQTGN